MKLKLIAYSPIKFTIAKALHADANWIAALEKLIMPTSTGQADAPDCTWKGGGLWQAKHRQPEPAADELRRLREHADTPGPTSCPQLNFLLSPTFLEWARKGRDTPSPTLVSALNSMLTRRDRTCLNDTGTNTRSTTLGMWAALVAHHRARPRTGALSPATMPSFTRDRSTTEPCELYNSDDADWTVRLHAIAPHSRALPGHLPWHIQPPAEPHRENLSALSHTPTMACTCALPGHRDSTTLPGQTRGLAGTTNRRLLHEHHLDIPSSVTSTALLDQLCPQCLHDALEPPGTDDAGHHTGDPVFVLLTWIPHDDIGIGKREPCGRAEQPVPARPPDEHTVPAEPDADAVLNTLKLLGDTTPSAVRAVLDTVQLLGETSLGTTRARTTRHAGSVSATADIINRYNAKVRHHNQAVKQNARTAQRRLTQEIRRHNQQVERHNQQRLRGRPTTGPDASSDTNS